MLPPPFLEVLGFQKLLCQAQGGDALGLRSDVCVFVFYLIVVLTCISLTISAVEHLFRAFWPFIDLPWENVFCPFAKWVVCFLSLLSYRSFVYFLDMNPLSDL